MSDDAPTNSELDRRFDRLERSIADGFARMDQQIAKMVTHAEFALFQRSAEQRMTAVETSHERLTAQHQTDMRALQTDVDQVEQSRADDRRNMIKIVSTVAVGLLGVIATLAGIVLPLLLS